MIEKYLHLTGVRNGDTAYHIWLYAVLLEALKQNFDAEKHERVLNSAMAYANGNWMRYNATGEQIRDLNSIVEELKSLRQGL